ncbi:hypothetical protein GS399_01405 [Pedobacter sp. HMF7647]|uniref:Lipoprotein n=1 Tax=Hufsiella arboris TaxID=2695275 RepID=A0A7K1Y4W1_9SPHI|nr:hypothetical protein [Hufsiella arboris]MXV49612.1 hypothetical protein [Hufsiella arboris]
MKKISEHIKISISGFLAIAAWTSFLTSSCKTEIYRSKNQVKKIYVSEFKLVYVESVLKKSFNNSISIQEILNEDKSGFTEPILTLEDHKFIDSLTTTECRNLQIDSANSIGRTAEGSEGKHVLSFIIEKIESRDLQHLAKKRYKIAKGHGNFAYW